jgi:hypothetical protein
VDDTVLDKPYSQKMAPVGHFWSGKHHAVVKGLSLVTLYCTDPQRRSLPVNYRVYDKAEKKTKNDCFQDRLEEVLAWGLWPAFMADVISAFIRSFIPDKQHLNPQFQGGVNA